MHSHARSPTPVPTGSVIALLGDWPFRNPGYVNGQEKRSLSTPWFYRPAVLAFCSALLTSVCGFGISALGGVAAPSGTDNPLINALIWVGFALMAPGVLVAEPFEGGCSWPLVVLGSQWAGHFLLIKLIVAIVHSRIRPMGKDSDRCRHCGYCLHGVESARCPECGTCR